MGNAGLEWYINGHATHFIGAHFSFISMDASFEPKIVSRYTGSKRSGRGKLRRLVAYVDVDEKCNKDVVDTGFEHTIFSIWAFYCADRIQAVNSVFICETEGRRQCL